MAEKIFFTGDTHFGHGLVTMEGATPNPRPWKNIKEHDEALVTRWNEVVPARGAIVYHVGDFALCPHPDRGLEVRRKLHGQIRLLLGNHDSIAVRMMKRDQKCWDWIKQVYGIRARGQIPFHIWLSHYPHRTWPHAREGGIHLHGHSHGRGAPWIGALDVGVDTEQAQWAPIPLEKIIVHFARNVVNTVELGEQRTKKAGD